MRAAASTAKDFYCAMSYRYESGRRGVQTDALNATATSRRVYSRHFRLPLMTDDFKSCVNYFELAKPTLGHTNIFARHRLFCHWSRGLYLTLATMP